MSDNKIRRVIIENDLTTVEQVTSYVKAGGGCSSCLADIEDLLVAVQQEKAAISAKVESELAIGKPLTTVQKVSLIQKVLTEEIRPLLLADGGDVELYDVDGDRVLVNLKGACGSCASSNATLKGAIETRLRDRVLSTLTVEAV